ncbi:MAG: FkbM family methyltransferase [Burkholderiaceae bacterium]|nr:FkbM family methyltransferase [Burkholderiaceae bacterium]
MSILSALKSGVGRPAKRFVRRFTPASRLIEAICPYLPQSICVDVGASYYPHDKWWLFLHAPNTRWVAVEPNEANLGYLEDWRFPCPVASCTTGLSKEGGPQTLYVTPVDSGSSLLEPVIPPSMASRIKNLDYFFPFERRTIQTKTLAEVVGAQQVSAPVFVKLDTQGSELSILSGAAELLSEQRIVGVESEFTMLAQPFMRGSAKFWQGCEFLEMQGFELLRIKPIHGPSRFGNAKPKGLTYLNECDAVFALRRDVAKRLPVEYRVSLLAFYLTYGFYEESLSLMEEDKEASSFLVERGCAIDTLRAAIARMN